MVGIPKGGFFAIKQMLQQQMQVAIYLYTDLRLPANNVGAGAGSTPRFIPIHRKENYTGVRYRCAIAFKLASADRLSAVDIATGLSACFQRACQDTVPQAFVDFTIEVVPPGWIDFHLSDRAIAAWLQHLMERDSVGEGEKLQFPIPNSLHIQYAHARCCSLLRLGQRERLICLNSHTPEQVLQVVDPDPIPWLNANHQLHLVHPAERRLIAEILELSDELNCPGQRSALQLADALTRAFESFYSNCQIFGSVKTQIPQLAQARLGLLAVTRSLLRSLLQDWLSLSAPMEL